MIGWSTVTALLRTRWLAWRLRSRADIAAWQAKRIARWRKRVLPKARFYAGRADLPVIDKATLMADFAAFNAPAITAEEGWRAFAGTGRIGRYFVGASTGTSGNRGLYVISEAERWRWLGTIVAKTMGWPRRARVALLLPLNTSLYDAAGSGLIRLRFFDLHDGMERCGGGVAAFDPEIVIAPPKVLRWLAESGLPLPGVRAVYSAAEVLDPLDRRVIEARFGRVREIYMATEGLLGVACRHGVLHLCEDTMQFELEPVAGTGLVSPIITDFSRTTQVMARYRMNDLLRLGPPCPCGSPLQAVAEVVGRMDDVLAFGNVAVTPDVLRNAIVDADRRIGDFRLVQVGPAALELVVLEALPDDAAERARAAVDALLGRLGVVAEIAVERVEAFEVTARKVRRIERRWRA